MDVPYCLDVSNPTEVAGLFETLISSHRDHSLAARFREKAGLLQLLSYFADHAASKITTRQADDAERITQIRQYVEGHLQDVVTLEDMAKHVHLHPNYLIKYFNKHFGMSPLKYINRKRMEKARFLLRTTSLSIKEVAKQTGFEDTNHFAKAFRRETSTSPRAWRSTM
jgi:AraC-like DNA-binding protein